MTSEEEETFQSRIPAYQRTAGRVWDDAYFETESSQCAPTPLTRAHVDRGYALDAGFAAVAVFGWHAGGTHSGGAGRVGS